MTNSKTRSKVFTIAVAAGALAVGFLLVAALMRGYGSGSPGAGVGGAADPERAGAQADAARQQGLEAGRAAAAAEPTARPAASAGDDVSPITKIFGDGSTPPQPAAGETGDWLMTFATVTVRLTLAALLS